MHGTLLSSQGAKCDHLSAYGDANIIQIGVQKVQQGYFSTMKKSALLGLFMCGDNHLLKKAANHQMYQCIGCDSRNTYCALT